MKKIFRVVLQAVKKYCPNCKKERNIIRGRCQVCNWIVD